MYDLNKIVLSGILAEDPKTETDNGRKTCFCSIAVKSMTFGAFGETETDIIPIVARRSVANRLNRYFRKGDRLTVVGVLKMQSGTSVWVDEIYFEK